MKVLTLNDHRALVYGRDGFFLINRHDFYVGKALETYGEYGQAEANMLQSLVADGDTVIEVGANIGAHTVGLAKKVGPRGRVYAYEPQQACYALLQSQIALNQLGQVTGLREGCGARDETLWHPPCDYDKTGNFGGVALVSAPQEGFEPVAVGRLDDAHPFDKVRLLKVDVEGMEADVLAGAEKIIAQRQPTLYLENDRVEKSAALIALVRDLGYRAWWHICPLFNRANYFEEKNNIYGTTCSYNMICMPANMPVTSAYNGEAFPDKPHPLELLKK